MPLGFGPLNSLLSEGVAAGAMVMGSRSQPSACTTARTENHADLGVVTPDAGGAGGWPRRVPASSPTASNDQVVCPSGARGGQPGLLCEWPGSSASEEVDRRTYWSSSEDNDPR